MALFKIFKGNSSTLPKNYKDGYCYFTIDDGKMYIDTKDSDSMGRILLNAGHADTATKATSADLATKATQDSNGNIIASTYLPKTGGKMSGDIIFTGGGIKLFQGNTNFPIWKVGTYENGDNFGYRMQYNGANSGNDNSLQLIADNQDAGDIIIFSCLQDGIISFTKTINGSISGNAATASKLATPRTISLTGSVTGSGTFDGSGNLSITTTTNHTHNYLPLSGGTLSGALNFSNNSPIAWTQGTWRQRISITDDDVSGTAVFHFQQSSDSGNTWTDLMRIFDNGNIYANTFTGALSGNATTATTLQTARTLTIGKTGKSFNGSANVSWSMSEIAAGQTISHNSFGAIFLERSGSVNGASIGFKNSNGTLGYIGMFGDANSGLYRYSADTSNTYIILDSNNYTATLNPVYVNVTGDTMTGYLTISTNNRYVQLGCQNSSFAHYNTNSDSGHWFNKNVSVQGNIFAGPNYNQLVLHAGNYSSYALPLSGGQMTGSLKSSYIGGGMWITGTHEASFVAIAATSAAAGQHYQGWFSGKTQSGAWSLGALSGSEDLYFVYGTDANYSAGNNVTAQTRISSAGRVYGAVWNDYAEYRNQEEEIEPGYIVISSKNGKVRKTAQRLSPFDGVISDTFGFAIGETDECKTPLAVAGRVLVYCEGDRNLYEIGDVVCASENGKACKMTREEIREWPDRIVGTVSEIPEYETWGQNPVEVNGRIWIKVK